MPPQEQTIPQSPRPLAMTREETIVSGVAGGFHSQQGEKAPSTAIIKSSLPSSAFAPVQSFGIFARQVEPLRTLVDLFLPSTAEKISEGVREEYLTIPSQLQMDPMIWRQPRTIMTRVADFMEALATTRGAFSALHTNRDWEATIRESLSILAGLEVHPTAWRPSETITAAAADFIHRHSLELAVEKILTSVRETYNHVERVVLDLKEDPEVEDYRWLAVTLRVRGEVADILESERRVRRRLRGLLRVEEYRKFVLSYELVA